MLEFKPVTLCDIPLLAGYFEAYPSYACDNSVGGVVMWRDYFQTEYAQEEETLYLKVKYLHGKTAFAMPLGKDRAKALDTLRGYTEKKGIPFYICTATEKETAFLSAYAPCTVWEEPDWADYIYEASALASFRGHRFNGQRGHVHAFEREHPYYRIGRIEEENTEELLDFLYRTKKNDASPAYEEEMQKTAEVLLHWREYGMQGLWLRAEEDVTAFSFGEKIGDMMFVHVEKARADIRGAYPMMTKAFAAFSAGLGAVYLNREEDVGDRGLRTAKEALHPVFKVRKYTVRVEK